MKVHIASVHEKKKPKNVISFFNCTCGPFHKGKNHFEYSLLVFLKAYTSPDLVIFKSKPTACV